MATIKAEYYRLNGAVWDKYYFKTTYDMIENAPIFRTINGQSIIGSGDMVITASLPNRLTEKLWGNPGNIIESNAINSYRESGWAYWRAANAYSAYKPPNGASYYIIESVFYDDNYGIQKAYTEGSDNYYIRRLHAGVWQAWKRITIT